MLIHLAPLGIILLSKSQLIPMLLSFAGMLAFAGIAAWLWLREKQAAPPPRRISGASERAASPPRAATPAPSSIDEAPEPTEFVPLPNLREDDSPQSQRRAREEAAPLETARSEAPAEEPVERTEFIPAPLELTGRAQPQLDERTAFVAPPESIPAEPTTFVAPPEPQPDERTAFVAPPEPQLDERTAFVAPPEPQLDERTAFVALPEPSPITPEHAPTVPSPPPSSFTPPAPKPAPAAAPRSSEIEFREHFELAATALAQLESGDASQATILHGHLELLASAPVETLLAVLRPLLASDPASARAATGWLLLFSHKTWPTRRALPKLLAELEPDARAEGLRSLASWDDPRAESLAAAGLEHGILRAEWLELFAARGWDPGDAAIEQALRSSDPAELVAGLKLAGTRPAERVRAALSAQLFASNPEVRIEAIETALVFREQSAWLVCRQLARNPAFPRAAELVGLLGSEAEIAALAQTATVAASAPLLWGLGLSGRPAALAACVAAFDDDELGTTAREALTLASGTSFDSASAAQAWLAQQAAKRSLAGSSRSLEALAEVLRDTDSLALRQAIARELRIRTAGKVVLTPMLRPIAWRAQGSGLPQLRVDLDAEFPWSGV